MSVSGVVYLPMVIQTYFIIVFASRFDSIEWAYFCKISMHLSRSLVADSHIGLVIDIWITFDFEKVSKTKYVEECRWKQPTYILHNLKLDSEKNGLVIDISCKNIWLTFLKSYKNHVNTRRTYSIPSNTVSSIA